MQGKWQVDFNGGGLTSETGFGPPCGLCDGRSLVQRLCARQGDVHVAYHRKPLAGMLRLPTHAQEVQDQWETGDGTGTAQEAQGRIEVVLPRLRLLVDS